MGFNLGHIVKSAGHSVGNLFKSTGKTIKDATSDVYSDTKHAISGVYGDVKSVTSYAGKHIITDVDKISSALSSPLLYVAIGAVIFIYLSRK